MPPTAKRNSSVILFDVKTSPEFAEASKKCLLNICASKWFLESKDCTKLILLNTEETNNSIHNKFGKCPHVSVVTDVINYDPKLIQPHIEDVETADGDWLMGLAVAVEELKENFIDAKGVMTPQLLFITDFSTQIRAKEKRVQFIIQQLNNMNIFFYILGPEVKIPETMSNFSDIQNWSKNVEFVTNEDDNPNLGIAKQIVQDTKNSVICGLELGQELFKCYTNRWGLQPWKVPLTIGSSVTFTTSTTRFLRPTSGPKLKKQTTEYIEPWKWHTLDDVQDVVAYDNVIGGVFKHDKFVPLPADVEKNFKYSGLRCFKIIGFTDKSNVPEYYMRGSGSCHVDSDGSRGFRSLIRELSKQNKVIIARRVYMANCRPKLVALLPEIEHEVFLLVELPYADNMRTKMVEQDVDEAPELDRTNPAIDAMYEYLQKLDISDPKNKDDGDNVKVPLGASLSDSWRHRLVTQRCLNKYLENDENMQEIDVNLPEFGDVTTYKSYFPVRPPKKNVP